MTRRPPTHRATRTRGMAAVAPLVAVSLLLAGCSSDEAEPASGDVDAAVAGDVEVTASDYAFSGIPARMEAGATLVLSNDSAEELHELVAIRLPDDEDRSASELLALPQEELAPFFPLVTGVVVAPPSAPEGMVVDGSATLTEPGRYLFLCGIPTGADPEAYMAAAAEAEDGPPEVEGGPPHFVNGMYAEAEVVAAE